MEFIAAAIVMLSIFVPVFLALEVATPHVGISRMPVYVNPEEAAERYMVAHPLKPRAEVVAANDSVERIAA